MPDGRFLSRSIALSEQLASVSFEADYLFARMIPHLDREGRISGFPRTVKLLCVPLRSEMDEGVVEACLDELDAAELIMRYRVAGTTYIAFPKFKDHQRGARLQREATSRIPPPDGPDVVRLRSDSGPTPPQVHPNSAVTPAEIRPGSGLHPPKRSEVKRSEELHPPPPPPPREAVPEEQPEEPSRPPAGRGEPELGRLLATIPESAGVEVDETVGDFFAEMGPDHPRRTAVLGYVKMWGNGMGVPPPPLRPTWPDIAAGLATYHGETVGKPRDYGEAHIRSFVMKFVNERVNPKPARNGATGTRRGTLMERNIANALAAPNLPPLPGDG